MFIKQWLLCTIDLDNARSVSMKKSSVKDVAVFVNLLTPVKCMICYQRMGYEVMNIVRRFRVVRVAMKGRRGIAVV